MPSSRTRLTLTKQFACLLILALTAGCAAPATPTSTPTTGTGVQLNAPTAAAALAPTDTDTPLPPTAAPSATATRTTAPTETAVPTKTPTGAAPTTGVQLNAPTTTATSPGTGSGDDFTPKMSSVWETSIGQDIMTGTCTGGPILPVYGLVQITPGGDTLIWLSQEPAPYTFFRTGRNTFYYSGPTSTGDGAVTMTLQFIGPTTLVMQRVFTPGSDPACQHTHNYTGQFQWNVP